LSTYIDGDMAHDTSVVRKSNILVFIMHALGPGALGTGLVVDDEGARDVDLDGARVDDGLLQAGWALATQTGVYLRDIGGSHDV
jgi:hypothetical protein